jgi:hypothetical protein
MLFYRLVGLAVVILTANSMSYATPSLNDTDSLDIKGTIGIVCFDDAGRAHLWNAANRNGEFDQCLGGVVNQWEREIQQNSIDLDRFDINDILGGYRSYSKTIDKLRSRWLRTR